MPVITKLERQKHNDTRVSVFVDGEYSFSLSDELIIEYKVAVGKDVTVLPLKEMAEEDEFKRAMACAFKHMSLSEKSEKQLREHLEKKEFSEKIIEKTVARLKELNYIDDLSYARAFVEHTSASGKKAILYKLKSKGISEEIINEALEDVSDESQLENAVELLKKQMPRYEKYDNYEKKRRLNGFLARKGYDWDIISEAIDRVFSENEDF